MARNSGGTVTPRCCGQEMRWAAGEYAYECLMCGQVARYQIPVLEVQVATDVAKDVPPFWAFEFDD